MGWNDKDGDNYMGERILWFRGDNDKNYGLWELGLIVMEDYGAFT